MAGEFISQSTGGGTQWLVSLSHTAQVGHSMAGKFISHSTSVGHSMAGKFISHSTSGGHSKAGKFISHSTSGGTQWLVSSSHTAQVGAFNGW